MRYVRREFLRCPKVPLNGAFEHAEKWEGNKRVIHDVECKSEATFVIETAQKIAEKQVGDGQKLRHRVNKLKHRGMAHNACTFESRIDRMQLESFFLHFSNLKDVMGH